MTDKTNLSIQDETNVVIEKLNDERRKIVEIINNRRPQCDAVHLEVFQKYFQADKAMMELLAQPETVDMILDGGMQDVEQGFGQEFDALEDDINKMIMEKQMTLARMQRLEKGIRELNECVAGSSQVKTSNDLDINQIEKNVMKRFEVEHQQLKSVIATIIPEDPATKDILAKLVNFGIKQPGNYVTLEDTEGVPERVALLMKTSLFEIHPEDPLQIRMIDLL